MITKKRGLRGIIIFLLNMTLLACKYFHHYLTVDLQWKHIHCFQYHWYDMWICVVICTRRSFWLPWGVSLEHDLNSAVTSDSTLVISINSYWQNSNLFVFTICQLLLQSLNSGSVWQNLILEALTFSNFVWTWLTGIMVIGNANNWIEMNFTVEQYTLPPGFTFDKLDINFVGF